MAKINSGMHMGAPALDNPRRCQAITQLERRPCMRWALKGSRYCQFHGGRLAKRCVRNTYLPGYYTRYLGKTLKEKVEEFLNSPHEQQIALYEELALSRTMATEALKIAAPILEGDVKVSDETRILAMEALRGALDHVKEMVATASRIEKDSEDKVSIKVIQMFVQQIVRAIFRVCGEEQIDLARRIEREISTNVRLPKEERTDSLGNLMTDKTPDMIAQAMDETVPNVV